MARHPARSASAVRFAASAERPREEGLDVAMPLTVWFVFLNLS